MSIYRVAPLMAPLDAVVEVPGSKSISNRALICAALAEGESIIENVAEGDDTDSMISCLTMLGIECAKGPEHLTVMGGRSRLAPGPLTLNTGLAGTTSRFLTALGALGPGPYTIDGAAVLRSRPMMPLHEALSSLGVTVHATGAGGHLPVAISGTIDTSADEVTLRGDISSQFLSALMLIAPYFDQGLRLVLSTELVSRPYAQMTAAVMSAFGVEGVEIGDRIIVVPAGRYRASEYTVEPDASSASYPLAAAAICRGRVHVPGVAASSIQGDAAFCRILETMGCRSMQDERGTTVERIGELHGIAINMGDHSDLVPTVAVVAAFAVDATDIRGVGFIRNKESDRLGDLCQELRRAGVDANDNDDGLTIRPGPLRMATLGTHDDHRLAMSLALLGLGTSGIVIEDPDVVQKSWPGYWSMIESLR